jgi:hypothetical protein
VSSTSTHPSHSGRPKDKTSDSVHECFALAFVLASILLFIYARHVLFRLIIISFDSLLSLYSRSSFPLFCEGWSLGGRPNQPTPLDVIRDRVMNDANDDVGETSFLTVGEDSEETGVGAYQTRPIADYFPHTTVMFASISDVYSRALPSLPSP